MSQDKQSAIGAPRKIYVSQKLLDQMKAKGMDTSHVVVPKPLTRAQGESS
jgi:post-segregation antitoxin (ccd killing protein)